MLSSPFHVLTSPACHSSPSNNSHPAWILKSCTGPCKHPPSWVQASTLHSITSQDLQLPPSTELLPSSFHLCWHPTVDWCPTVSFLCLQHHNPTTQSPTTGHANALITLFGFCNHTGPPLPHWPSHRSTANWPWALTSHSSCLNAFLCPTCVCPKPIPGCCDNPLTRNVPFALFNFQRRTQSLTPHVGHCQRCFVVLRWQLFYFSC